MFDLGLYYKGQMVFPGFQINMKTRVNKKSNYSHNERPGPQTYIYHSTMQHQWNQC